MASAASLAPSRSTKRASSTPTYNSITLRDAVSYANDDDDDVSATVELEDSELLLELVEGMRPPTGRGTRPGRST